MNQQKLIVGLGNPGQEYKTTRHNIGFIALDNLSGDLNLPKFKPEKKFKAEISMDKNIILAKPQTFMNLSGEAVKAIKQYYKIKLADIIVIHDDIDLPVGKIRISQGSSSGGHKGIDSIIQNLKTKNFIRIRVGVANELRSKIPGDKFVLQNFNSQDKRIFKDILPDIIEALKLLIANEPLDKIQNKFN